MVVVRAALCVILAAGCGRIEFADGVDAAADSSGPPDTVSDMDLDGVADALDNCPRVANASQHDEDADLVGDACDGCPHLADDGADADGDGVGDLCDPRAAAVDHIVSFVAFDTDPATAGWQAAAQNTTWQFSGDDAIIALAAADVAVLTFPTPPGTVAPVDVLVTIDVVNPSGGISPGRNVAVIDNYAGSPGTEDTLMFGLHQDQNAGPPALVAGFRVTGGAFGSALFQNALGGALATGTRYLISYDRAGTNRDVTVSPGVPGSTTAPETGGSTGLRVRGLTVHAHSITVID